MSKSILVPVDLADLATARRIISAAVEQSGDPEARVTVLAVVPEFITGIDYRYAIRGETGGSGQYDVQEIVQDVLERLNALVADTVPEGQTVETVTRHGTVYEQILQVADEVTADQIVIGAHRPQLSDYLLGPNTARVVRHARCSVNVVRL